MPDPPPSGRRVGASAFSQGSQKLRAYLPYDLRSFHAASPPLFPFSLTGIQELVRPHRPRCGGIGRRLIRYFFFSPLGGYDLLLARRPFHFLGSTKISRRFSWAANFRRGGEALLCPARVRRRSFRRSSFLSREKIVALVLSVRQIIKTAISSVCPK